jgi:hypothetical protein
MSTLNRKPFIDASYQVSIRLQTWPPQAILVLLAIVVSVLLRFTASDCLFGIFKPFLLAIIQVITLLIDFC